MNDSEPPPPSTLQALVHTIETGGQNDLPSLQTAMSSSEKAAAGMGQSPPPPPATKGEEAGQQHGQGQEPKKKEEEQQVEENGEEEYRVMAEQLKDEGNAAFKEGR